MLGFRVTSIWPLNPRAMDKKTNLSNLYIENENWRKRGANSISNDEENDEMQQGKHFVTIELINIATTIHTIGHESLVDDVPKGEVRYYVVMPTKSTIVNKELATNSSPALVVNKYKFIMKMGVETKTFKHTT
jgi:hypothetical protein